jgi:hypothetical protein
MAGKWNKEIVDADFTTIGRILRAIIPVGVMGHMLCYVITKKGSEKLHAGGTA